MKRALRVFMVVASTLACVGLVQPAVAAQKSKQKPQEDVAKVILQVSDSDPAKWNLALNNAKNVQEDLGKDKVKIEIVAYGPGLGMLKLDSAVAPRVAEATADGVAIVACENTMRKQKLTQADMLPNIGFAKAGVVELMQKQKEGYAYIRP